MTAHDHRRTGSEGRQRGGFAYVEDNNADAVMIETAMQQSGCTHDLTRFTGVEVFLAQLNAIRADEAVPPDALLLDINLPDGSGFEILAAVRQVFDVRDLPVAVFSGGESERDIRRAYDLGANVYVDKPMEFPEYRRRIAGICEFFSWITSADEHE